jgi:hypothetical protein
MNSTNTNAYLFPPNPNPEKQQGSIGLQQGLILPGINYTTFQL